jgi:hypothetical protein
VTPGGAHALISPGGSDVMLVALAGDREQPLVVTDATERNGVVSPNGRWLAYESDADSRFQIYVQPFPDVNGGLWKVTTDGGRRPLWSTTGDELFFEAPDTSIMGVRVDASAAAWSAGSPTRILEPQYLGGGAASPRNYDVWRDGRFLMVKPQAAAGTTPHIVVTRDWDEPSESARFLMAEAGWLITVGDGSLLRSLT